MKRREFLSRTVKVGVVTAPILLTNPSLADLSLPLTAAEDKMLDQIVAILLPSRPSVPGAAEINASDYIRVCLVDRDIDEADRKFLAKGFSRLAEFTTSKRGQSWDSLNSASQEEVLREFVEDDGDSWVSTVLSYVLEALLGDPAYGVNKNGVGWRWLEHQPGFPRPESPKWYRSVTEKRAKG